MSRSVSHRYAPKVPSHQILRTGPVVSSHSVSTETPTMEVITTARSPGAQDLKFTLQVCTSNSLSRCPASAKATSWRSTG